MLAASACAGCGHPETAKLEVAAAYHDCPPRMGITVQPLSQQLGGQIELGIRPAGSGRAPAYYRWVESAARGRFANPSRAETTFLCTSVGSTTLTLNAIDEPGCHSTSSIEVSCVPVQLCGNQQIDPGEVCDGRLGADGGLPKSQACAPDCSSIVDATELETAAHSSTASDVLDALAAPGRLPNIAARLLACDQASCAATCFP